MRLFIACMAVGAWACNSAPPGTCTPSTGAVVSAAQSPATCMGACVDAESAGTICVVDCTDAGNAACDAGTACGSVSFQSNRYCLPTCAVDADAGACPPPLSCSDAGVCTL